MAKLLSDHVVEQAALALNDKLYRYDLNGRPPDKDICQAAAEVAAAVPVTAVNLSWLLDAAGPEIAAAVRAQAKATTGSAASLAAARLARSVLLSATKAAERAGVSDRAIRAACARDDLAASKNRISGEWQIAPGDLDEWIRRRRRHAA